MSTFRSGTVAAVGRMGLAATAAVLVCGLVACGIAVGEPTRTTQKTGGGHIYQWVTTEVFNNIVRFAKNYRLIFHHDSTIATGPRKGGPQLFSVNQ